MPLQLIFFYLLSGLFILVQFVTYEAEIYFVFQHTVLLLQVHSWANNFFVENDAAAVEFSANFARCIIVTHCFIA